MNNTKDSAPTGSHSRSSPPRASLDQGFVVEVATGLWRLEQTLRKDHAGESPVADTRAWKVLQRLKAVLDRRGIRVEDRTGHAYDEGMSVRVVASEEDPGLERAIIAETVSPGVFFNDLLLNAAEVVVAVPPDRNGAQKEDE